MICGGNEHFNRWLGAFKPEETRFGAKPGSLKARLATFLAWPCVGALLFGRAITMARWKIMKERKKKRERSRKDAYSRLRRRDQMS